MTKTRKERENSDCDSLFKWVFDDTISTCSHCLEDETWGVNSPHYLLLKNRLRIEDILFFEKGVKKGVFYKL